MRKSGSARTGGWILTQPPGAPWQWTGQDRPRCGGGVLGFESFGAEELPLDLLEPDEGVLFGADEEPERGAGAVRGDDVGGAETRGAGRVAPEGPE